MNIFSSGHWRVSVNNVHFRAQAPCPGRTPSTVPGQVTKHRARAGHQAPCPGRTPSTVPGQDTKHRARAGHQAPCPGRTPSTVPGQGTKSEQGPRRSSFNFFSRFVFNSITSKITNFTHKIILKIGFFGQNIVICPQFFKRISNRIAHY